MKSILATIAALLMIGATLLMVGLVLIAVAHADIMCTEHGGTTDADGTLLQVPALQQLRPGQAIL